MIVYVCQSFAAISAINNRHLLSGYLSGMDKRETGGIRQLRASSKSDTNTDAIVPSSSVSVDIGDRNLKRKQDDFGYCRSF